MRASVTASVTALRGATSSTQDPEGDDGMPAAYVRRQGRLPSSGRVRVDERRSKTRLHVLATLSEVHAY